MSLFGCLIQAGALYINLLGIIIVINMEFLNLGMQNYIKVIPIVGLSQRLYLPLNKKLLTKYFDMNSSFYWKSIIEYQ